MQLRPALAFAILCSVAPILLAIEGAKGGQDEPKSKPRLFKGQVLLEGKTGNRMPAHGAEISILGHAGPQTTDKHGEFILRLPQGIGPGVRIKVSVIFFGYRVAVPSDGFTHVPLDENEIVEIILLQETSLRFLPDDQIERTFLPIPRKSSIRKNDHDERSPYLVSHESYCPRIMALAAENGQDHEHRSGKSWILGQGNLLLTRTICIPGTLMYAQDLQIGLERDFRVNAPSESDLFEATPGEARDRLRKSGDRYFQDKHFFQALKAYNDSLALTSKDSEPALWAQLQSAIGSTQVELGIRSYGKEFHDRMDAARQAYTEALEISTRNRLPEEWASLQSGLGNLYGHLGLRTGAMEGLNYLDKAVLHFQKALTVLTYEKSPVIWATTQLNLGNVLSDQALRTGGEESYLLAVKAESAYNETFKVFSKSEFPSEWAATKSNLGNLLFQKALRGGSEESLRLLAAAVNAYYAALTVYTKEALPQNWAMTQNNLGNVLRNQGIRTGGEEGRLLLAQAVAAYRAALEVRTRELLPQSWAMTQNNLGNVLRDQGIRTGGEEGRQLLAQAVAAYRAALEVYTRELLPQQWATTQNNLGNTLSEQGIRTGGEEGRQLLAQAVAAYRAALEVYTRELLPQDWAMTQNNLGAALNDQGIRTGGEEGRQLLAQAVAAYRAALEIRTREHLPQDWAQTHNNLAKAALLLEDWPTAAESYRNVLTLYPDYNEAYQASNAVYHDKLFAYHSAFEVTKHWLDRHPNDLSAQANFAEAHLTTGRYGEAERRLAELLKNPDPDPSSLVGLRVLEIANALALRKAEVVPQKLQELRTFVSQQPDSFSVAWSFDGTKHYVETEQVFARYRIWLTDLFAVVKSKDRAALLAKLDSIRSSFPPSNQ